MNRKILITGAFLGLSAIVLGAFGAHGLKKFVSDSEVASFSTGVTYQMYHALFCLFLGVFNQIGSMWQSRIFNFLLSGIILFSGSIYLLVIDSLFNVDLSAIGFITPLGGLLLIISWILLIISLLKIRQNFNG
ncbi:DUF423 domain-containing protein [Aquimarina sp. W85]|uniref:DUF423 domain-containing protein n=1 Tax=Aquimarina rhodophyticola TaxID=3342246 RepID=UPI003671FD01